MDVVLYLARGEDIFPVPGEGDGADLVPVVSLEEGGDTPVGHRVPDLDAAVHGTRHKMLSVIRPSRKKTEFKMAFVVFSDETLHLKNKIKPGLRTHTDPYE